MTNKSAGHDAGEENLSPAAREVCAFLRQRGASFFADIVRGVGRASKPKSKQRFGNWSDRGIAYRRRIR